VALELPNLRSEADAVEKLLQDFALNVRASPRNIVTISPHRILESSDVGGRNPLRLTRYTNPTFLEALPMKQPAKTSTALPSTHALLEDAYVRFTPAQRRVIRRRHNLLSNRFKAWLSQIGATEITIEKDSVDVSCVVSKRFCLFELKTCYALSTRLALREALGQILEYGFYPGRMEPDFLAIVLDAAPSETDLAWVKGLAKMGVFVELFWLIGEELRCAELTKHPLASRASAPSNSPQRQDRGN
jgi:hypothetical protein